MNFEKISFDVVKTEIEKLFLNSSFDNWQLVPNDIHKLAEISGIILQWEPISWWNSFEKGDSKFSNNKFIDVLFENFKPLNGKVIIVTDECFSDKLAYNLDYKDFLEFSETIYPNIHQMDFFQPSDYIFLFSEVRILTVLHHEGYVMQFESNEKCASLTINDKQSDK